MDDDLKTLELDKDAPRRSMQRLVRCPACDSPMTESGQPSSRVFYGCGSYGYDGNAALSDQTELCSAWKTLLQIEALVTTNHETKDTFIARVRAVLTPNDEMTSPHNKGENHE